MIIEIILIFVITILLYIFVTYFNHLMKIRSYPPGPFPFPIIGNLHLLSSKPYIDLKDIARQYGDVFSISLGMRRVVIINTIEPAREALITNSNVFAGRPTDVHASDIVSRGYQDIACSDFGPIWKMLRKYTHSSLKFCGEGINKLQSLVDEESMNLNLRLKQMDGIPVDIQSELGLSLLNVITEISYSRRYKKDDEEIKTILEFTRLIIEGIGESHVVIFLPWLKHFPINGLRKIREGITLRDGLLRQIFIERREKFNGDNIRDFMDILIKALLDANTSNSSGKPLFTLDHLEMIIGDIFLSGSATVLTSLRWCILYLLHWPHYQDRIYKEIINVVGSEKYPDLNERSTLHLLNATINETLRLSSSSPVGVLHKTMNKSKINNISIPKDSDVLINFWNIHHDERYWKQPHSFFPERWLDESGKFNPAIHRSYLPFSAGRRVCLGEYLAKTELYIFMSRLIKDFTIELIADAPLPTLKGELGLALTPVPFKCLFKARRRNSISKNNNNF